MMTPVVLFFAQGTASLLTAVSNLMAARWLSLEDFGRFMSALAIANILHICADMGMGIVAARRIAGKGDKEGRVLNQIYSWRIAVMAFFCAVLVLALKTGFQTSATGKIVLHLAPMVLLMGMADFYCWIFKGFRNFHSCALLLVASQLILFLCCLGFLANRPSIASLLNAYAAAGCLSFLLGYVFASKNSIHLKIVKIPRRFYAEILPDIAVSGAMMILCVVFSKVDTVMIHHFCDLASTALYASASRVIDAIRLIPSVIFSLSLPVFASLNRNPRQLKTKFIRLFAFSALASLVVMILGLAWGDVVFGLVFGSNFHASFFYFKPLLWSCLFFFENMLMIALLYSQDDYRTPLLGIASALLLQITLNGVLLPYYGAWGAGVSRLIAEGVNFTILSYAVLKRFSISPFEILVWKEEQVS